MFRLHEHVKDVESYLKYVVEQGLWIYGESYPSINVHSLLHLVEDYEVGILSIWFGYFSDLYIISYFLKVHRKNEEKNNYVL